MDNELSQTRTSKSCDKIAVVCQAGQYAIEAAKPISAGDTIYPINGAETKSPTMYSVQMDFNRHIDSKSEDLEDIIGNFPWRFTNHSCDPNAKVHDRKFVAVRDITPGEQVTYMHRHGRRARCHIGHASARPKTARSM